MNTPRAGLPGRARWLLALLLAVLLTTSLVVPAVGQDAGAPSNAIDRTGRTTVIESHRWDYLWHLDDIPDSVRTAALRSMNWYRSMAGFPTVTLDSNYNTRAQKLPSSCAPTMP